MTLFFDLDGPILDVSLRMYRLYADLLDEEGYPVLPLEEYWALKRQRILEQDIVERTAPREILARYVPRRQDFLEQERYLRFDCLIPGAREVLAHLQDSGHRLVLVTLRRNLVTLYRQLSALELPPYFDTVLAEADNPGSWQVKEALIRGYTAPQPEDIIIGDSEADIEAGKRCGMITCAVLTGIRNRELLEQATPDRIIESIRALPGLLTQLLGEGIGEAHPKAREHS